LAFKNYFSDAGDFISLVEEGCRKMSKTGKLGGLNKVRKKRVG
jgi:hypothetical protein